jgi:glycosyltransferase involved in cell wall biosynthesis
MPDPPDAHGTPKPISPCLICSWRDGDDAAETIAHVANRRSREQRDGDIALLLSETTLPDGWLERLRTIAGHESTTATVGPMLLDDFSALERDAHADPEMPRVLEVAADEESVQAAPRTGLVSGPCILVTRAAFDLLGGLDETLPTSAAAVAAFGLRAQEIGLANLLAPGLVVIGGAPELGEDDRLELHRRFPALWTAAQDPPSAAVERRAMVLRAALGRPSVTIDARTLDAGSGGTQVYVRELLSALAADERIRVRALIDSDAQASGLEELGAIETITYQQALGGVEETDLVHRPLQVFTIDDLNLLRPLGRRLVISHLDLIAYHNPSYFSEISHWRRHVRATRIALGAADHVVFFSRYALMDAHREDLIDPSRASVVPAGVDATERSTEPPDVQPAVMTAHGAPFILCLGTDYSHKNRPFALELTAELRGRHGWRGTLVLAGPHVADGSSADAERQVLKSHDGLAEAIVDVGPVSDAERRWLMDHARALVYPTVLEGFGLVPFEAAIARIPCLYAAQSSLAETLPTDLATLEPWSVERSASLAIPLLVDDLARARHVDALQRAARDYSWKLCAERTIAAYRQALNSRASASARAAWEAHDREREIVRLDKAVQDTRSRLREVADELDAVRASFGDDAIALVGPSGLLRGADQRALLALAARDQLRRPMFAALRAGYRLLHGSRPEN